MTPKKAFLIIIGVSALISIALMALIYGITTPLLSGWQSTLSFLPTSNAVMNAISAFSVVMGIMAIKRKDQVTHQKWMLTALVGSALFLVGYVLYHCVFPDKLFLGQGWIRPVYFFILISHILCTIIGLPFILGTFFFALTQKFEAHKKLARITAPLWLYISITGVMVYLFLHL